MVHDDIIV